MPEILDDYLPNENEEFMNPVMLSYFKQKLLNWKIDLSSGIDSTYKKLQNESSQENSDLLDRASVEVDMAIDIRTKDRMRKLILKIDQALARIEDGTYGYCLDTGEPIDIKRLEVRPIATYSLEAQERHEKYEKSHSEDNFDMSSIKDSE